MQIDVDKENLISGFSAVVLESVEISPSPSLITKRLEMIGVGPINNVVDISNYLLYMYGQPMHIFDYDSISGNYMVITTSKKGESVTTLDGNKIKLPGGDVVIKDKSGRIIDLAGIMGGANTRIMKNTKRILLFVPHVNKQLIRRTIMNVSVRTPAATYYEKGLDEDRIEPQLVEAVKYLNKHAKATVASQIINHHSERKREKIITVRHKNIEKLMGIKVPISSIERILTSLGFKVSGKDILAITIPSYRMDDIHIEEDITEEIARIYGYHRIPSTLSSGEIVRQPSETAMLETLKSKARSIFVCRRWIETYNYSMVSAEKLDNFSIPTANAIMVTNPINEEGEYMRPSLIPSLCNNIKTNIGFQKILNIFEIARVYTPDNNGLPKEKDCIGLVSTNSIDSLKGMIESLFNYTGIDNYCFAPQPQTTFLAKSSGARIMVHGKTCGYVGLLKQSISNPISGNIPITVASIYLDEIAPYIKLFHIYKSPNLTTPIKLDLTYASSPSLLYGDIRRVAFRTSKLLSDIELLSYYNGNITLRFTFFGKDSNITDKIAKRELEHIKDTLGL